MASPAYAPPREQIVAGAASAVTALAAVLLLVAASLVALGVAGARRRDVG